ncbi:hypothetical protein RHMOL_Rhmol06G0125300 [Rhododendron molle]|uniref:Uncharacterized protein n=1 Tax=Rhododendron molle TaxID=49168 RepID=A0ACC0NCD2_RHOML|nr:hypothetical protein RHMOL_Rhmol06G0125300 [Rhododendron molle]
MVDQPLTLEAMIANCQNSIITTQQRATQTDANINQLNDLVNTRLPSVLEAKGKDDEDVHKEPVFIEDPNHARRLIVQPILSEARAPAANPNPAGGKPVLNPNIAALMANTAKLEESVSKSENINTGEIDLDRLCILMLNC